VTTVPFVGRAHRTRAGVGAACTQASTSLSGPRGLDLLEKARTDALEQLLANDAMRESRQVGIIDMKGRTAAHTGKATATGPAASRA
jgi:uncharacterized Ntn-hydrolase superfamily protein